MPTRYRLILFLLAFSTISVSTACSFSVGYSGSSPICIHFVMDWLGIVCVGLIAAVLLLWLVDARPTHPHFAGALCCVFFWDWAVLSINVADFHDWALENVFTLPFAALVVVTHKWFRLSNFSYVLIFIYLFVHIIGTHYTYAHVPLGYWLQDLFGTERNNYDRIVHLGFGLLMAYPMREVAIRIGDIRGFWALWVPVEFILAFSAIYEIIEWGICVVIGGDLGIAYLGTQGDAWDPIKDMAMAGLGACVAMLAVLTVRLWVGRQQYRTELRQSLSVKRTKPLGESFFE